MYIKKNNNNNNNNRFRNNNGSNHNNNTNQYSLNYKFDSSSIAGKCSGTALELIKKYNELAKEALSNHDYVSAEIFKQYSEHYRKVVTDINDKKPQAQPAPQNQQTKPIVEEKKVVDNTAAIEATPTEIIATPAPTKNTAVPVMATTPEQPKKSLRKKVPLIAAQ